MSRIALVSAVLIGACSLLDPLDDIGVGGKPNTTPDADGAETGGGDGDADGGDPNGDGGHADVADATIERCRIEDPFGEVSDIRVTHPFNLVRTVRAVAGEDEIFISGSMNNSNWVVRSVRIPDAAQYGDAQLLEFDGAPQGNGFTYDTPVIPADRDVLYFIFEPNFQYQNTRVHRAARAADAGAKYGPHAEVEFLADAITSNTQLWMLPDEKTIYFGRAIGGGDRQLYVGRRTALGDPFSETPVSELVAPDASTSFPVVDTEEQVIYFARTVGTKRTVMRSVRDGGAWSPPVSLTDFDAGAGGFPTWLSNDRCTLYFLAGANPGPLTMQRATRKLPPD